MPIKEAIQRAEVYQGRILDSNEIGIFRGELEIRGRQLLQESCAFEILEDLRSQHGDIEYPSERRARKFAEKAGLSEPNSDSRIIRWAGGNVSVEIGWRYRNEPSSFDDRSRLVHDSIDIMVQPSTGDIVVSGEVHELITKEMWSNPDAGRQTLEAAVTRAYEKPGKQAEPVWI